MKRIGEFVKRNIAGEALLVPTGKTAQQFNGMITMTEVAEFIYDHIEEATSMDNLIDMILEEYDVDRQTASQDATVFLMQLLRNGIVRPDTKEW